jgi:flagellar biosynthesis protein FliR
VDEVFGQIFISAIAVAAPVLLAVIITDCAFGVVSRVMPQLNVFAVGFPAKILVGFVLIGASLPFVADWIGSQLTDSVRSALQTLQVA